MRQGVRLLVIEKLRAHEQVCPQRLAAVMNLIREKGKIVNPIIVDKKTKVILDGHHRAACLKQLGCKLVPVMTVDYLSDQMRVFPRRKNFRVSKAAVLIQGLAKRPFPHKTTRNWIRGRIRGINFPLDKLK